MIVISILKVLLSFLLFYLLLFAHILLHAFDQSYTMNAPSLLKQRHLWMKPDGLLVAQLIDSIFNLLLSIHTL